MKKILFIYIFFLFNQFLYAECQYIHRFEFYVGSQVQYCSPSPVFGHYIDGGKGFYCRKTMHSDNCTNGNDGFHDSDYFDNALITSDGVYPNPDPLGGSQCRDLFQKDGVAYTCNPNNNEATPIENSDGVEMDEDGNDRPRCNDGYESTSTMVVNGNGNGYTSWGCSKSSIPETGGTGDDEGTAPSVPDVPNSGITTSANGTKSWSVGGTTYELTTDGTLTTTYADGTTSVKNLGSDYYNSGSSGGSSSGGTGGSGSNGNTTNETDNSNNNDTPIDNTPVADNCNDSNLTLQEKMLCELNAGMKKQNSESNPENSLNNLLKDMNNDNNTNATAINTNLKNTNTSLTGIKSLNENQLAEQKKTNDKLRSVENGVDGTNLLLGAANTKLEQIRDNLQDEEGTSYLSKISEFFSALTTPTSDEDKNSYSSQINDKVSSTLSNAFSKYSNVLGFGSTYANRPENITITLFNQEYTLLDFSVFDAYVSIIRSLFLTLAYMYGFMNLIKGSK